MDIKTNNYQFAIQSFPFGSIILKFSKNVLFSLSFYDDKDTKKRWEPTSFSDQIFKQLTEYFSKKRKKFDIPLSPSGTPFQKKVWQHLKNIPYGETMSYKQIAIVANSPKGARAVGTACGKNPIPIIIPCHRVVRNNGALGGYALGIAIKQKLLNLENSEIII